MTVAALLVCAGLLHGAGPAEAAAPVNDAFADATEITGSTATVRGTNVDATAEPDEPGHYESTARRSVWWTWEAPSAGMARIDTCGSGFDTTLAVYSGASLPALQRVASDDDGGCDLASLVEFVAEPGIKYRIAVDGYSGRTGDIRLRINPGEPYDSFADAYALAGSRAYFGGSLARMTAEPGEPVHAGQAGGRSLWLTWAAPVTGAFTVETCSSDVDTLLGVYTGDAVNELTEVASADDGCGSGGGSRSTLLATRGVEYHLAIDGKAGATGYVALELTGPPANDAYADAADITDESYVDGYTDLATSEPGEPGGRSVWYRFTALDSGPIALDTCDSDVAEIVVLEGDTLAAATPVGGPFVGECPSDGVRTALHAQAGRTYRVGIRSDSDSGGYFELRLGGVPSNDDRASAIEIDDPEDGRYFDNALATAEAGEAVHAGVGGGRSVWFEWTPSSAGRVTISTCGATFDTVLAVYTEAEGGALTPVASNDDGPECDGGSVVSFRPAAETRYLIAVDGRGEAIGRGYIGLTFTGQPRNDDFAGAYSTFLGSQSGSNVEAGLQTGEPQHAGQAGGASVWYRYVATSDGRVAFDVCTASFDTVLAVYEGPSLDSLAQVAASDDSAVCGTGSTHSSVTLRVTSGTEYRIAVDGKDGAQGTFTLRGIAAPANDDFADAATFNGYSYASNVGATREAGEPLHAGVSGERSIWYTWTASANGPHTLSSCNSFSSVGSIDTALAVYTGTELNALIEVAANDDDPLCGAYAPGGSRVRFTAVAGTTYRFAVDTKNAATGSIGLSMTGPPSNDNFASAYPIYETGYGTPISGSIENATAESGEPAHAGAAASSSVWHRLTSAGSGRVSVITCGEVSVRLAVYTGSTLAALTPVATSRASVDCPSSGSGPAPGPTGPTGATGPTGPPGGTGAGIATEISFAAQAGVTYQIAIDAMADQTQSLYAFEVIQPPVNDRFGTPQVITSRAKTAVKDTRNATAEPSEPAHGGSPALRSVWFAWTAPESGSATIGSCTSLVDTRLAVYTGASLSSLTPVTGATGDQACADSVRFDATAGTTYRIAIDDSGTGGKVVLSINPPPNDGLSGSEQIAGATASVTGSTAGATSEMDSDYRRTDVWYHWNAPASGTATVKICPSENGSYSNASVYRGTEGALEYVSSSWIANVCSGQSLTFAAAAGVTYRFMVSSYVGYHGSGDFRIQVNPPANDDPGSAQVLTGASAQVSGTNVGAGQRYDEQWPVTGGRSVWFTWTAPTGSTGRARLDTCDSGFDTLLDVSRGGAPIAYNDDAGGCGPTGTGSRVAFDYAAGAVYLIGITGKNDAAGDYTLNLNRIEPETSIDGGPTGTIRTRSTEVTFSSNDSAATFECALDLGPFSACTSPRSLTGLADGVHTIRVRAVSAVATVDSTPATRTFTVDATPPRTTFETGPPAFTNDVTPSFTFRADEAVSGFVCAIDGESPTPCTSPLEAPALADGEHSLEITATDLAGNVESPAARRTFTVDTAVGVPEVSGTQGLTNLVPQFTFSLGEPATFTCELDGSSEPCASGKRYPNLADGAHSFRVRAVDRAGNTSAFSGSRSFELDTVTPAVTLAASPSGEINTTSVELAFTVDDAAAQPSCSLDGSAYADCLSPVAYEDLADGNHTIGVRATDLAGNVGAAAMRELVVDTAPPETRFTDVPNDPTNALVPSVSFDSEPGATFRCRVDEAAAADCTSPHEMPGLDEGWHTVSVRATDRAGTIEPDPEEYAFEIDRTPPNTTITGGPTGPVHDSLPAFEVMGDELLRSLSCKLDGVAIGCGASINPAALDVGEHFLEAIATDLAGNDDPTPASVRFTVANEAPVVGVDVAPATGVAPHDVAVDITATDADDDLIRYRVEWGDGIADTVGVHPADDPITHVYEDGGVYVATVTVEDSWERHVATETLVVAPGEPLQANAGDDRGGEAGEDIAFDAGASRPTAGIDRYQWTFGDGQHADGRTVRHAYAQPGTYTARLSVTRNGETAHDTATVQVRAASTDGLGVFVTAGGAPLPEADVALIHADGRRFSAITGANGTARLAGVPDGVYSVYADKVGYAPAVRSTTITNGVGSIALDLERGDVATASLTSRPLTYDEIIDRGIDPDDPANQNVVEFEAVIVLGGGRPGQSVTVSGAASRGGFWGATIGGSSCVRSHCRYRMGPWIIEVTPVFIDGRPMLSTLVIPFKASWLKEFFDVSMTISNLAPAGFTLTGGSATFQPPDGLPLAPTAEPQSQTVPVPDIPGGQSRTVHWTVRGDREGEYDLAATYAGRLDPVGRPVNILATTARPLKVWGGSAIRFKVDIDDEVRRGHPLKVRVGMENVADVPVYNANIELLREGRVGYIEQPRQERSFGTHEIAAGTTWWSGDFILVPKVSGTVDLSRSFVRKTAGDVSLNAEVVTHPRDPHPDDDPAFTATRPALGEKVALTWAPIPGATQYQLFRSPDLDTDFPDEPLLTTTKTSVMVDGELVETGEIAVSAMVGGNPTMVHPLLGGLDAPNCSDDGPHEGFLWSGPSSTNGPANCSTIQAPKVVKWIVGSDLGPVDLTVEAIDVEPECQTTVDGNVTTLRCRIPRPFDSAGATMQIVATDGVGTSIRRYTIVGSGLGYGFGNRGMDWNDGNRTNPGFARKAGLARSDVLPTSLVDDVFTDLQGYSTETLAGHADELYSGLGTGGTCFGMALTGGRFDAGTDALFDMTTGRADTAWDQDDESSLSGPDTEPGSARPAYTKELLRELMAAMVTQRSFEFTNAISRQVNAYHESSQAGDDLYAHVEQVMTAGSDAPYSELTGPARTGLAMLVMYFRDGTPDESYGHAVVAHRLERHDDGTFTIHFWDNNFPGQDRAVEVQEDGSWRYDSVGWYGSPDDAASGSYTSLSAFPLYRPRGLKLLALGSTDGPHVALADVGSDTRIGPNSGGPVLPTLADPGEYAGASLAYTTTSGSLALEGGDPSVTIRGESLAGTADRRLGTGGLDVSFDLADGDISVSGGPATLSMTRDGETFESVGASSLTVNNDGSIETTPDGSGIVTVTGPNGVVEQYDPFPTPSPSATPVQTATAIPTATETVTAIPTATETPVAVESPTATAPATETPTTTSQLPPASPTTTPQPSAGPAAPPTAGSPLRSPSASIGASTVKRAKKLAIAFSNVPEGTRVSVAWKPKKTTRRVRKAARKASVRLDVSGDAATARAPTVRGTYTVTVTAAGEMLARKRIRVK